MGPSRAPAITSDEDGSRTVSAYDIDDARSCAESLYMTRTVAAVDAVAGSAYTDLSAERWAAERTRREASAFVSPMILACRRG